MPHDSESSLSLHDIWQCLVRRRLRIAAVFAVVMLSLVAALFVWPRTYESTGKLYVKPTVKQIAQDPTASSHQQIPLQDSRDVEVISIVEMLHSRAMAEKVVDQLSPAVILNLDDDADETADDGMLRDVAIRGLVNSVEAHAPKGSAVINVSCKAASPELAQRIVATLLDLYLVEHVRVNRTDGSYDFFREQSELCKQKLDDATEKLRAAKSEIGVASIAGQRASLEEQANSVELQIIQTQRDLTESQAKVAALTETVRSMPEKILLQEVSGIANVAADDMRNELYKQQAREQELRAKYTDEHPAVIVVRQQVAELQQILDEQSPERKQETLSANPARRELELSLLTEQSRLQSLEARSEKLAAQQESALSKLKQLNAHEMKINELERSARLAETTYHTYAEKLEQARMHTALETGRISNVKIAQAATFEQKPVSPRKGIVLMVGFVLALGLGIGAALVAEYFNPSLRTREAIEAALHLPVIASIPRVPRGDVMLN